MPSKVRDIRPNQVYGLTNALSDAAQKPIVVGRPPQITDHAFLGTLWIDPVNQTAYILVSILANVANWIPVPDLNGNVTINGILSLPHQPAFSIGMLGPDALNATGNGTVFTVPFAPNGDSYDSHGDIDLVGSAFIAPVFGVYHFDACVHVSALTNTKTEGSITIGVINGPSVNPFAISIPGAVEAFIPFSCDMQLLDGAIIQLAVEVSGGTQTVTVNVAGTYFNGHLVA